MSSACIYYLNGNCKAGDNCKYAHVKERPVCKYFEIGKCNHGDKCFNAHIERKPEEPPKIIRKVIHKKVCKECEFTFYSEDNNVKCKSCLQELGVCN